MTNRMRNDAYEAFNTETFVELDGHIDEDFVHSITKGNLTRGLEAAIAIAFEAGRAARELETK